MIHVLRIWTSLARNPFDNVYNIRLIRTQFYIRFVMAVFGLNTRSFPKLKFALMVALLVLLSSVSLANAVDTRCGDAHVFPRQRVIANNSSPGKNKTEVLIKLRDNVHCYALPYGGLGFGSHVMTYYCMFVNAYGRRPLVPWKRQEYQKLDVLIGFLQLVGTTIAGTLTITRCRGESQLQLLGIWMVLTSGASSIAAMFGHGRWLFVGRSRAGGSNGNTRAPPIVAYDPNGFETREDGYNIQSAPYRTSSKPYPLATYPSAPQYEPVNMRGGFGRQGFWSRDRTDFRQEGNEYGQWLSWGLIISLWLVGCAMGFIGSVGIAKKVWDEVSKVRQITIWFFMPAAVMIGLSILVCTCTGRKKSDGSYEFTPDEERMHLFMLKWTAKICLLLLVFMLIYMDWLLAAVTGNWSGVPSKLDKGGKVLYWAYFACKRFALFSS